jgi:cold shock CspA family protein
LSGGRKVGWVVRLVPDRAFGFIKDEQGDEYFMHKSNCSPNGLYTELQPQDPVSFAFERTAKGMKAIAVRRATDEEAAQLAAVERDNVGNR